VILGHTIALDPTPEQEAYFRRAAGTARYAYNWGLVEWQRAHKAGEKPTMGKVKAAWNAHRAAQLPWTYEVTKCASTQAIRDLGTAFSNFFHDLKKPNKQHRFSYPKLKRKTSYQSFALWNDQFDIDWYKIRIPKLGWVRMHEHLRLCGVILGARVAFSGGRWFVSIQVDAITDDDAAPAGTVAGVDLGITTLATVSSEDGTRIEKVTGAKARQQLLTHTKRLARRLSKQTHRARKAGVTKASRRQYVRQLKLSKLHARIANIRKDAAHKLTTDLTRRFRTIVIEDLNVSGMSKNHALAGAVLDGGWYAIRRQLEYKATMRGGRVVVADRFYPSSKTCFDCGVVVNNLPLSKRSWVCACGAVHDRDGTASMNLERLGWATPEVTRGDTQPLPLGVRLMASSVMEPRI
jgi:putative transposase